MTTQEQTELELPDLICPECLHNRVINKCSSCDKKVCCDCSTNVNGNIYCQDCFYESYSNCDHCGGVVDNDIANIVDEMCYCEPCFRSQCFTCDNCGDNYRNSTYHLSDDSTTLCANCGDDYSSCDNCGHLSRDSEYCEDCDTYYCPNCYSNHGCGKDVDLDAHARELISDGSDAVTDYHPKVDWKMLKEKTDNKSDPFFGIELEIEGQVIEEYSTNDFYPKITDTLNTAARLIGEKLQGRCICSHDGSLTHGFEIVFTPHKRQAFRKINFNDLLKSISKAKCTSFEKATCGLHVHIERTQFLRKDFHFKGCNWTMAQIYQRFFSTLSLSVKKFSRRKDHQIDSYCRFQNTYDHSSERYVAVNLSNSKTIEIRVWRGTLEPKRFKANILFSLAVLDFLKAHSIITSLRCEDVPSLLSKKFREWLVRADEYQFLLKYLKSKRLFGF